MKRGRPGAGPTDWRPASRVAVRGHPYSAGFPGHHTPWIDHLFRVLMNVPIPNGEFVDSCFWIAEFRRKKTHFEAEALLFFLV
jgi:hypothetical protein